jgi:hypothetical protein
MPVHLSAPQAICIGQASHSAGVGSNACAFICPLSHMHWPGERESQGHTSLSHPW